MKQTLFIMLASLLLAFAGKDIHVIVMTPTPQMHCESCEKRIKENLYDTDVQYVVTDYEEFEPDPIVFTDKQSIIIP